MNVSAAGLALIVEFEGFVDHLYNDPSPKRNCTIGYGYLVHAGPCDGSPSEAPFVNGITEEQGMVLLLETVQPYADCVEGTSRPLNQNEFDALVDFTYNEGQGGYINSSVRTAVNNRGDVCAELRKYIYAGGVVLPGLQRRREEECALFMTPVEDDMFVRFNETAMFGGVPGGWNGREYPVSRDNFMIVSGDFAGLPANARLLELDLRIDPTTVGDLVVRDGTKAYADTLNRQKSQSIVAVIPGADGKIYFDVLNAPVKFTQVGIVGYWN